MSAIEQGQRLAQQADALAEYIVAELDDQDEAERALREEDAHEWMDPAALAAMLAETPQQDPETQQRRDVLVADLQQGLPDTMPHLLRERCGNNPTELFLALQQAAAAIRGTTQAAPENAAMPSTQGTATASRRTGDIGLEDSQTILARLQDMTQELELSHGTRIRADLNTGGVWRMPDTARQLDAAEILSLQASYTTLVEGDARIASVLHRVLDGVGALRGTIDSNAPSASTGGDAHTVLERFILAVGRDIDALRPSVDREHLHALLTEKSHVVTAVTVLQQCDRLGAALHPQRRPDAEAAALRTMRKAVELTEQSYFTPDTFVSFARTMAEEAETRVEQQASPSVEDRQAVLSRAIPFLHGFSVVVRDMPERVFADAPQRGRAREAVQHALDDLIDEENADV